MSNGARLISADAAIMKTKNPRGCTKPNGTACASAIPLRAMEPAVSTTPASARAIGTS